MSPKNNKEVSNNIRLMNTHKVNYFRRMKQKKKKKFNSSLIRESFFSLYLLRNSTYYRLDVEKHNINISFSHFSVLIKIIVIHQNIE